jgi:hypothetical protein
MDSLEYEVLSNLEAGRSMFRPRNLSGEAQQAFVELMGLLLRLRREGFIELPDGRGRACGASRGGAGRPRARTTSRYWVNESASGPGGPMIDSGGWTSCLAWRLPVAAGSVAREQSLIGVEPCTVWAGIRGGWATQRFPHAESHRGVPR